MKKNILTLIGFYFIINTVSAQLANWTAYNPSKFPTNLSGQIHGQARVVQLKFHPTNANKYYALTAQGGLFTSNDQGQNWTVSAGTDALSIKTASICIDYTNDQVLYLGSGDPNYYGSGAGIYKSSDGGTNFAQLTGGLPTNRLVVEILMHPTDHNTLVAATDGGIFKSTNGGATWTVKTATNLQFSDLKSAAGANSLILFASTTEVSSELYRSTDFGETWTQITSGISAPTVAPIRHGSRIAVTPADPNVVYFGQVSSGGMIYKSTDGGLNFTSVKGAGLPYLTFYDNVSTSSSQGNYNYCITADRNDANKIWLQSHNTWYSADGGASWTMLTYWPEKVHTDMHQISESPYDATKLYSCNDGGVWLSTDGGNNWTPKSDGIFAFEIGNYAGKGSPTRRDFINIGTQDNGELYADSTGWYTIRGGDWYAYNEIDYREKSTMMYYNENAKRRSATNRIQATYGLPSNTLSWVALEFNRTNNNLAFVGLTDTVFRTTNVLATTPTWIQLIKLPSAIKAIHSSIADPNRLYVLAADQKIYVSTNALSATPTFTPYNLPSALNNTATITAICNNADIVYISINNKVYRSSNGGQTWTDITYNLPSVNHRRILSEEYGGTEELVFIATNNAVYYKKAGQTTWTNYSTNLPNRQSPTELSMYDDGTSNSLIRYTSFGRGVFQTPFSNLRPFQAIATATQNGNPCQGNVFTFNNVSTGTYTSISWSFPSGTPSSSTDNNPIVSYPSVGSYTATLTVNNGGTISTSMVTVNVTRINNCSPDGYAGTALQITSDGQYAEGNQAPNITSNTVTMMAWVKPSVIHSDVAPVIFGGNSSNLSGLNLSTNNELRYHWNGSNYWSFASGLFLPVNEWSHVALVITPTEARIYLNGQFATKTATHTAADFTIPFRIGSQQSWSSRTFKGLIDETAFYNRALTTNEIREQMHLTKDPSTDASLIAYYQFNETAPQVLNHTGGIHATMTDGTSLVTSTAPMGAGVSSRLSVTTSGVKDFTGTNCQLEFPSNGVLPNGDVVVTQLNVSPDQNPAAGTPLSNKYWIINNFGTNQAFKALTSINFSNLNSFASGAASNYKLYQRKSTADGATWGTTIDGADILSSTNSNTLTFTPVSTCKGIVSLGSQFTITDDAATPPPSAIGSECEVSTVIGKAMSSSANGDYMLTQPINLGSATNTITLMAWIRPNGIQSSYAAILSCNGVNVNLNLRDNNELGFHWNDAPSTYNWSTALIAPANEWSLVALVITGTDVTIYLNGKPANKAYSLPNLDLSNRQWYVGIDRGNSSRTFKGLIDEVGFYNRALTQNEIREKMHLLKDPATDATLKGYFQFNETNSIIWNKSDANPSTFSGSVTRATSTAPAATGTSQRMSIMTGGVKDFATQHLSIEFPSTGTLPSGEITVSELAASPDQFPTTGTPLSNKYWIVDNYGSNATFAALTGMTFSNLGSFATGTASNFKLYKRATNADGATWGASIDAADALNSNALTFSTGSNITSFSQFTITNEVVLAVEILDFNAILNKKQVDLTWHIADEKDVNHYIIERSFDAKSFVSLKRLNKGELSTVDDTPQYGMNYYRLKIIENDGRFSYSPIRTVQFEGLKNTDYKIYPNPTNSVLNIQFDSDKEESTQIEMLDNLGRTVHTYSFTSKIGNNHLFFDTQNFPMGYYVLKIKQNNSIFINKIVLERF